MNKRGFTISFAWLFGIIAGIVILSLAIYATTRVVNLGQYEISAETQRELGILLNPLETGLEESTITIIALSTETRIYNTCDDDGIFGRQILQVSQKNFGKWSDPAQGSSFENRYIFSGDITEGKNFYIFTKPFEFPFKVADLTYVTSLSEQYCFINSPGRIENEISGINQENVFFVESENVGECEGESIKVCFDFGSSACDVIVDEDDATIRKNGNVVHFYRDALMYGAIFSNEDVYECQLSRLVKRTGELASLYQEKSSIVSKQNCGTNLDNELNTLVANTKRFEDSEDIISLSFLIEEIEEKNNAAGCRLW